MERARDRRRKRLYVYYRNQKRKREKKPTTPAPVYLKSIKGYHHKIFVFPLRTNGTRASPSIFFPPLSTPALPKHPVCLLPKKEKLTKKKNKKNIRYHVMEPQLEMKFGTPSCGHVRVMQHRSCEPSHPSH